MAIQFTDFSSKPILESPFKNMLEDVLKGYKISQEPAKMKQESSARELANSLKKLEVEHKPKEYALNDQGKSLANALHSKALEHYEEKFGLERDLKKAQIQKLTEKGLQSGMKMNGAVANAEAIYQLEHDPNADPEHVKALKEAFKVGQEHTQTVTNRSKDMIAGGGFDKLPTNEKKRAVGLMTGMGVDPVEGTRLLRSGLSPSQYAQENNIKIDDVTPVYPLGEENIKQLQKRTGFVAELKNLEGKVSEPLSKYPAKIKGYSFKQIADSIDNKNPDEMAKVLASRALAPEIASLRLKVASANIGIEAIKELTEKSMQDMKIVQGLVTPEVYLATQKYMTDWLEEASNAFNKNQEEYGRLKTRDSNFGGVKVYNPKTGRLE